MFIHHLFSIEWLLSPRVPLSSQCILSNSSSEYCSQRQDHLFLAWVNSTHQRLSYFHLSYSQLNAGVYGSLYLRSQLSFEVCELFSHLLIVGKLDSAFLMFDHLSRVNAVSLSLPPSHIPISLREWVDFQYLPFSSP